MNDQRQPQTTTNTNYQNMIKSNATTTTKQPGQVHMHSLLNVKLASLAENNYHTTMTPDAIANYYDESPNCSPPNGYHSPNPSPPNGFHSPNPTPPNGYLANTHAAFHDIVNPPIMFYGDDTVMGYDEDQFMKTMRILTSAHQYNDIQHPPNSVEQHIYHQQQQQQLRQRQQQQQQIQSQTKPQTQSPTSPTSSSSSPVKNNNKKKINNKKNNKNNNNNNSSSSSSNNNDNNNNDNKLQFIDQPPPSPKIDMTPIESSTQPEDDDELPVRRNSVLSKEDKRRRNTQASARFRVKKKLREQALQNTANEMTDKANRLQSRVHELEREVQWLKALIVEKKESRYERLIM